MKMVDADVCEKLKLEVFSGMYLRIFNISTI